jgi:hypothetical protein
VLPFLARARRDGDLADSGDGAPAGKDLPRLRAAAEIDLHRLGYGPFKSIILAPLQMAPLATQ